MNVEWPKERIDNTITYTAVEQPFQIQFFNVGIQYYVTSKTDA